MCTCVAVNKQEPAASEVETVKRAGDEGVFGVGG